LSGIHLRAARTSKRVKKADGLALEITIKITGALHLICTSFFDQNTKHNFSQLSHHASTMAVIVVECCAPDMSIHQGIDTIPNDGDDEPHEANTTPRDLPSQQSALTASPIPENDQR
jgi:hypothetical protein